MSSLTPAEVIMLALDDVSMSDVADGEAAKIILSALEGAGYEVLPLDTVTVLQDACARIMEVAAERKWPRS
jgi:hypothetical protein